MKVLKLVFCQNIHNKIKTMVGKFKSSKSGDRHPELPDKT